MEYSQKFESFNSIKEEMKMVYKHDNRPWLIGFSGGKDSTLLCCLVIDMIKELTKKEINKKVYIISSDTGVENPIVGRYMHKMSKLINDNCAQYGIIADIVKPNVENTFWSKVIGLGYPTPEPPGFRWCTDRLKIKPMNQYITEKIKNNGEVILLLGVRKAESQYRSINIKSREIQGKILIPHTDIKNAFVYNSLKEVPNSIVWEFLLSGDAMTPWGSDNKYLFSLYQGENLPEEKSVIGEIDDKKIPVTGNSRFGCWICTMVKEDKSLKSFIDKGAKELIPLRDFRNKLLEYRNNPEMRDNKRRNGSVYTNKEGEKGLGPFTLDARYKILEDLLKLQKKTKMELITMEELRYIDEAWDKEGDLTRRKLVDLYYEIFKTRLPWDEYKTPVFDSNVIKLIIKNCQKFNVDFEFMRKLVIEIDSQKNYTRSNKTQKAFDKIINQGWLHYDSIREVIDNEN